MCVYGGGNAGEGGGGGGGGVSATHTEEQQCKEEEEGRVCLPQGLDLVPLVGHKICPPNAHR